MANRVLRRPMFRMGGSPSFEFQEKTSGILSGLDGPKLNASRTGYKPGGVVTLDLSEDSSIEDLGKNKKIIDESGAFNLMDYNEHTNTPMKELIAAAASSNTSNENTNTDGKETIEDRIRKNVALREKLYREYGVDPEKESGAPGSFSSALMNFGINLLAQPGGNLAGAIGKAGSPALKQFQQARMAERLRKGERSRDMIDDAIRGEIDLESERIEAQGAIDEALAKASGTTDKAFQFQAKFDRILETKNQMRDLQKKIDAGEDADGKAADELASLNAAFNDLVGTDPALEAIYKSDFMNRQIDDITDKFVEDNGRPPTTEELLKILKGKKDGGRIKYAEGGEVMEEMSESIDMVTGQGQTQDLSYRELRSRLPREITDDVISLIAVSKQALTDFANIQTQQDVDNFNQSYNVDLVLPQEG